MEKPARNYVVDVAFKSSAIQLDGHGKRLLRAGAWARGRESKETTTGKRQVQLEVGKSSRKDRKLSAAVPVDFILRHKGFASSFVGLMNVFKGSSYN